MRGEVAVSAKVLLRAAPRGPRRQEVLKNYAADGSGNLPLTIQNVR